MKSNYKKIGQCIQLVDERNRSLDVSTLLGININKNYIPTVANTTNLDLSNYKIIRKNRFACNIMHVGRDERLPISLYSSNTPALVSPAYTVFESINENEVLPEYLIIIFQRPEFDRYTWFISDSSIRGGLEWERFCEIEIPLPKISEQIDIVRAYNSLIKNQSSYEKTLSDMQLICDMYIEKLSKEGNLFTLGEYIEKTTEINSDDLLKSVMGISEKKEFREPAGKVNKDNLSNHLIVHKNEFAYIPRMNPFKPLAIALSQYDYPVIVSPSYVTFKISREDILIPEFLLLFFKRKEFDRYAAFNAWSSTRDTFDWNDLCEVKVPIPDVKTQELIIAIHHSLESRKRINEALINMITPMSSTLMKGVTDRLEIN